MSQVAARPKSAMDHAEDAARKASPWIVRAARLGFAAKGAVYFLLGALALSAAVGVGRSVPTKQSVISHILAQPFGSFLLAAVAVGFLGFALWRFVQAILNPDRQPQTLKGVGKRLAYFCSGILHICLAAAAAAVVVGLRASGGDGVQDWTRWGMLQPFGKTVVGCVGLGVVGRGLQQLYKSWKSDLPDELRLYRMKEPARKWAVFAGRFGLAARGVVFGIVGSFLVVAAWYADAAEARGLGGALATLERAPYGPYVLATVAAGLIAYGLFNMIEARYTDIAMPQ